MLKPNERLGNYEVASSADGSTLVLGSGAGGVTYRGRHVHLGTEVAIKVLIRRKNLQQKDRDAFLSEARSAASLSHPQIARILDFGESSQQHPYYVMELCEGGSLEDFGRQSGPPDRYTCIQWLFESAAALAHAHHKGILHRDIKPSNLLVARENETATLKLIDFGLADHADQNEPADTVIGTPLFAAPEQLRGQAEAASDVFSLGATFLWLLTGKHLSQGDVKSVISDRLEAVSYSSSLASLPATWQALLGKMIEVDPARRLRDGAGVLTAVQAAFPDHPGRPVAWSATSEFPNTAPAATLPSHWADHPSAEWSTLWTPVDAPVSCEIGASVRARRTDGETIYEVSKFENLSPDLAELLCGQADLVARHAEPLGLDHVMLDRGTNWWTVAWPSPGSADALSWVRQGQTAGTAEILAALAPVALSLDGMKSGGFEHMEIHPSMLIVNGGDATGTPLKFSLAVQLPVIPTSDHPADSAGTMRGATGAGLSARFGACVYQLLSGRTLAPAAFVNSRAYQAIPKLTEKSNRFLSTTIAGAHGEGTCRDVIRGLAYEERIPGSSHSGGASLTSMASTAAARSHPSISIPPPVQAVSPPPTPQVKQVEPTPPPRKRIPITGIAAGLLVLGILGWFLMPKPSPTPAAVVSPPAPDTTPSPQPPTPPEPPPATPAEPKSIVKVPTDAPNINDAVHLCKPGGTIEIDGGTYAEAIVLTKSLSIIATRAAVFEDRGLGSNLIIARGPIQVTLRNIQLRNTQQQAGTALASSPALVLVTDGSAVAFDGCVIESSVGNGVSLADKASATFSNCNLRRNRGYGINVSSGSKVEISLSEIRESGRSGIAVANVGTSVILGNGARVAENSQNGVEVANGATLRCSGAEINGNQKVGLIVEGSGSNATLDSSCVLAHNRKYGVGLLNSAKAVISDSTIEDNSENGLYLESGAQAEILSCNFKSNGAIGVYLVNGPTSVVTISKSVFESHSDSGAAFVEGTGNVSGSRFLKNPMAIFYANGARGTASGNTVSPGPVQNALVTEEAGEVILRDNTVEAGP